MSDAIDMDHHSNVANARRQRLDTVGAAFIGKEEGREGEREGGREEGREGGMGGRFLVVSVLKCELKERLKLIPIPSLPPSLLPSLRSVHGCLSSGALLFLGAEAKTALERAKEWGGLCLRSGGRDGGRD